MSGTEKVGHPVSFRLPVSLKARLDEAALHTGRSLSAEMQARLERSLLDEGRSPSMRDPFIVLMAAAVDAAEAKTGRSWRADPQTADACRRLIGALLAMLPEGEGLGRAFERLDVNPMLESVFAPLLAAQELSRLLGSPERIEVTKDASRRKTRRVKEAMP